jgi:hypothetical protein
MVQGRMEFMRERSFRFAMDRKKMGLPFILKYGSEGKGTEGHDEDSWAAAG